jgi:imidazolonepropionase
MQRNILIWGARQLLTLRGRTGPRRREALRELGIIEDGAVLIADGRIVEVGPARRVENLAAARSAEEVNATGHVVMPGFVDSHTHLVAAPARSLDYPDFSEQLPGHGPLVSSAAFASGLQHVRQAAPRTLELQARRYLDFALRHGTTTMEVKSGHALNHAGEMKILRVIAKLKNGEISIVPTFFGAQGVPPEYSGRTDEYMNVLCTEALPIVAHKRLAEFADIVCDPAAFNPEQARRYFDTASALKLGIKVHAEQATHMGIVPLAVSSGAVTVDGLNHARPKDVEVVARSSTVATLLPGFLLCSPDQRLPPARELIDAGAAVALASSFHPSADSTYNMQMIVSLACAHFEMTAAEAISAATINGAHALGRAASCGSLEVGKDADLLILNVSDFREMQHHFGGNVVHSVIRKGEIVHPQGESD